MSDTRTKPRATKAMVAARLRQTEIMLVKGYRHNHTVAVLQHNYGIGRKAAEKLISRVYKRWRIEAKKARKTERAAQINRLKYWLEDDADKSGKLTPRCDLSERLKIETLLAKICGTEAPVKHTGATEDDPIRVLIEDYRSEPVKTEGK